MRLLKHCARPHKVFRVLYRALSSAVNVSLQSPPPLYMLGIETSFDETSIAVVASHQHPNHHQSSRDNKNNNNNNNNERKREILSNVVYSQRNKHFRKAGGVIPVYAAELHREALPSVYQEALSVASIPPSSLSAIAFTLGPGLGPCLLEGLQFAQKLARDLNKPVIPIHHMEAHALTARLVDPKVEFPFLVLLASGAHCILLLAEKLGVYQRLGSCLDDAPGEAFDKIARMIGLPGGKELESLALHGDKTRFAITTPLLLAKSCDFSFAGIKAMSSRFYEKEKKKIKMEGKFKEEQLLLTLNQDIAASAQNAICKHILNQTHRAIVYSRNVLNVQPATLVVSGGVACNSYLRSQISLLAQSMSINPSFPPVQLCADNAAMIGWTGLEYYTSPEHHALCLLHPNPNHPGASPLPLFPSSSSSSSSLSSATRGILSSDDSRQVLGNSLAHGCAPGDMEGLKYITRWELGTDVSSHVKAAGIPNLTAQAWKTLTRELLKKSSLEV